MSAATGTATNKPFLVSNAQFSNFGVDVVQWKDSSHFYAKAATFTFVGTPHPGSIELPVIETVGDSSD